MKRKTRFSTCSVRRWAMVCSLSVLMVGCIQTKDTRPELSTATGDARYTTRYLIAPGDSIQVFVWRNPEVTTTVPVRPDGLLSAPLLEELPAAGKTPSQLARDIEEKLSVYLRDPLVTVIVTGFAGTYTQQIRVVGEASSPKAILYKDAMTLLDVMVSVGGLTNFADGNQATLVRVEDGTQLEYRVRLDDLIRDGDISANVDMRPGDILIIPEAWF